MAEYSMTKHIQISGNDTNQTRWLTGYFYGLCQGSGIPARSISFKKLRDDLLEATVVLYPDQWGRLMVDLNARGHGRYFTERKDKDILEWEAMLSEAFNGPVNVDNVNLEGEDA